MIQFALLLILGSATIVGYGLFALAELAARSLRPGRRSTRSSATASGSSGRDDGRRKTEFNSILEIC